MSIYTTYSPNLPVEYRCPICLQDDSSAQSDTVAHTGLGHKHPVHKTCIKLWLKTHNSCPSCITPIDTNLLFSWKERPLHEIKCVARDLLNGAIGTTIGGIIGGVFWIALGGVAITGVLIPIGRTEASSAGFGFLVSTGAFNPQLQSLIIRGMAATLLAQIIEPAGMLGFPIVNTTIATFAALGATFGAVSGWLERHS